MSLQKCYYCNKTGHCRITSKQCGLNAQYTSVSPEGRARLIKRCRAIRDAKRAETQKRKAAVRIAGAKRDAKRSCTPERKAAVRIAGAKNDSRRVHTLKRKMSRKTWKLQNACDDKSRNIAKESQTNGIYAANSRTFVSCAAADIAKQVASHVNVNEEDVKMLLTPLQDSEILRIKKQWDEHINTGANCQICSTCGIIGLDGPREYPLQNPCISAFKVICVDAFDRPLVHGCVSFFFLSGGAFVAGNVGAMMMTWCTYSL